MYISHNHITGLDFLINCSGTKYSSFMEHTLLATNISPYKGTFEDDCPFPMMGYGPIPWRVS